jgi:small GTP-binding protein
MNNKKVLVTGYSGSGKTALVNRFVHNRFSHSYTADYQLKVDKKDVRINKKTVNLVLWTAPGSVSQVKSFKSFYLGTDALIHVIDVNKPGSFADLDTWINHYKKHLPSTPVYLACNKIEDNPDLDCSQYFEDFDCYKIFFTSAKNTFMVDNMFQSIAADLVNENFDHKIKIY